MDEIDDPQSLDISTRINGQTMQKSNTCNMIFPVAETLAYLSQLMTLEPGDIIATGTPEGVGFKRNPPVFLRDGDVVEVEIEKIGILRNPVVQNG
jgi:2-keto-4-pentenoate hydratase/2-oxohepta-3-ene-1,7-dioic acid hydratase in catechol pathway